MSYGAHFKNEASRILSAWEMGVDRIQPGLTQELLSKPTPSSSICPDYCENGEIVGEVNIFKSWSCRSGD